MKKIQIFLIFLLIIPSAVFALSSNTASQFTPDQYLLGNIDQKPDQLSYSDFKHIESPSNLIKYLKDNEGVVWLKAEFSIPESLKGKELSILLGKVIMADETYINGNLIGRSGSMGPKVFNTWNHYRHYEINNKFLNWDSANTILVKVYGKSEIGFKGNIRLDSKEKNEKLYKKKVFWTEGINSYVFILLLFFSIFPLISFIQVRSNKNLLYLPLVLIFYSIYSTNFFATSLIDTENPIIDYFTFQKIVFSAANFLLAYMILLYSEFLHKRFSSKNNKLIQLIALFISFIYYICPSYGLFLTVKAIVFIFYIVIILLSLSYIIYSAINKNKRSIYVLITFIPVAVFLLHDIILHIKNQIGGDLSIFVNLNGEPLYLMTYGSSIFLLTTVLLMTYFFSKKSRQFELLNKKLEQKISERTKEYKEERDKALEMTQYLNKQLDLAKNVQLQMLPQTDQLNFISSIYKPVEQLGGDLYEYIYFDNGNIGIFISDVSGKGVASALITSMLKTLLLKIGKTTENPSKLLSDINQFLYHNLGGHYVTAVYGIYCPKDKTFTYSNAGHHPPMIINKNGITIPEDQSTFPMGVMSNSRLEMNSKSYHNKVIAVPIFSKLLLYTNGFLNVKSANDPNESFEKNELDKVLIENVKEAPKPFIKNIYSSMVLFHGGENFSDDVCLICIDVQ